MVDAEGIIAGGQRVFANSVLWSAGVLASPAGHWLRAATDKSGRVIVNPDLSVPGHPEVFAIGDTAHVVAQSRNLLGIKAKEPMAWIVWAVVHIYFLIGFANRFFVLLQWSFAFITKRRQVRIFPSPPKHHDASLT